MKPELARAARKLLRAAADRDERRLVTLSSYQAPEQLGEVVARRRTADSPSRLSCRSRHRSRRPGVHRLDGAGGAAKRLSAQDGHDEQRARPGSASAIPRGAGVARRLAVAPPAEVLAAHQQDTVTDTRWPLLCLRALFGKPKAGFGIPLDDWLGDTGRRHVQSVLTAPNARIRALIRPPYVEELTERLRRNSGTEVHRAVSACTSKCISCGASNDG